MMPCLEGNVLVSNFLHFILTPMRIKPLLLAGVVAATATSAFAFDWTPVNLSPNPKADVTSTYNLQNLFFNCQVDGVEMTDVMPVWVDEDSNEIKALFGEQNPFVFDPTYFSYTFDPDAFKANGEYTLLFPEGMLVDASGDKSAKVEISYIFDIPELAPAMFDDFKVLSITPDLSESQAVWNDQVLTINTNHNDAIGRTDLTITDTTTGEVIVLSNNFSTGRGLGDESEITWEVVGSYKFFEGHLYVADIIFYNGKDQNEADGRLTKIVDRVSYEFEGRVEGYRYSSVQLLSVEPEPMSFVITDPSQAVFTYTFSAPVTIYKAVSPLGQNGQNVYPASCLSSNEDKTVWTLDLSDNEYVNSVDAMLTIYVYVRDEEGYQLRGDWGEEGESCFITEWECELGAFPVEIVVPEKEAVIERLTEVVVKSVDGNDIDWAYGTATIQSRNREALGELYYEIDFEAPITDEIRFTQWIPAGSYEPVPLDFAKDGVYSIIFPHACFVSGEQFDSKLSHSVSTTFEISNGAVTPPSEQATFAYVSVDPESETTVTSLESIVIVFPDVAGLTEWTIDVYKEGVEEPVAVADLEYDPIDWNAIDVNFREPITADGVYTITFKEGIIGDDPYCASNGETGVCNPEFKLVYTIGQGSAVESVAQAARADVYDVHGRLVLRGASSADMQTLSKGIYVVGGRKVVVK